MAMLDLFDATTPEDIFGYSNSLDHIFADCSGQKASLAHTETPLQDNKHTTPGDEESSLLDWFDNHFEEDSRQGLNISPPDVLSTPKIEASPANSDSSTGSRISFFSKVTQSQNGVSKVDQILPKKKKRKNKNATHKQPKRKIRKSPKSDKIVHSRKPWDILEQNLFFHHWFFHTESLPDTTNIVTMASDIAGHIPAKTRDDVITFYHTVLLEIRRMLGTMDSELVFHPAFGRLALPLLHRLRGCYSCSIQLKKAFTKELFARVAKHPRLKSLQTYNMPAQYQKLARGGFVPKPHATMPSPWHTSKQSSPPQPPLQYNYAPALQFSAPVGALNRAPSLSRPPPLPLAAPQHQLPSPSPPVCVSLGSTNVHTSISTTLTPGTLHQSPLGQGVATGLVKSSAGQSKKRVRTLKLTPWDGSTRAIVSEAQYNPKLKLQVKGSRRVSAVFEHLSSKWIRVRRIPALANAQIRLLAAMDTGKKDTKRQKWISSDDPITVAELWTLMGQPEKQMCLKYTWVKASGNAV